VIALSVGASQSILGALALCAIAWLIAIAVGSASKRPDRMDQRWLERRWLQEQRWFESQLRSAEPYDQDQEPGR
jgi:hypothetical protein